jgi:shikimate dehydrogenase
MIDGRTQLVGLIGWPVEHSLSPTMHNAAFEALGLNWRYVPLPVQPQDVAAAVRGLAALGYRGANVTVPHKRAVMTTLDTVTPEARTLGAVNTIVFGAVPEGSGGIHGCNTDADGFALALRASGFEAEAGKRVVVVGAGGAARAVVSSLLQQGISQIVVLNRTVERAQALVSDLGCRMSGAHRLQAMQLADEALIEHSQSADLLVNTTTVGMWPETEKSIWPHGAPVPRNVLVFDLVYTPLETALLKQARDAGAHAVGGLGMLVHQGALSCEIWTGVPAPLEIMRGACERALARRRTCGS